MDFGPHQVTGAHDIGSPITVYTGDQADEDYFIIDQPWELNNTDYMHRVLWAMQGALAPTCRRLVDRGFSLPKDGSRNVNPEDADTHQLFRHLKENVDHYATELGQDVSTLKKLALQVLGMRNQLTHAVAIKGFSREDVLSALKSAALLAAAARTRYVQRNIDSLEEQFKTHTASKKRRSIAMKNT